MSETSSKQINFETSLSQLEELVSAMEEESIPLEDLLRHYEKGNQLIKDCETSLKAARQQLETIRHKSQNSPSNSQTSTSSEPSNDDDEIRLF